MARMLGLAYLMIYVIVSLITSVMGERVAVRKYL